MTLTKQQQIPRDMAVNIKEGKRDNKIRPQKISCSFSSAPTTVCVQLANSYTEQTGKKVKKDELCT